MKQVQALLSTYNGETYVAEQIESILTQKNIAVSLLVRDDGSTDQTLRIVSRFAGNNVQVYAGENIGTQKSFFDLLMHADAGMGYYAFADQDDVWHPRKLQKAVEALEQRADGRPRLYAGRVIYASKDLSIKKKWNKPIERRPDFGNALVENICMGCTEVFNRELLELVRSHLPGCAIYHDWWLYMTAAHFGEVVFDESAYILYRQHGYNQVGMQDTGSKHWKSRLHRAKLLKGMVSEQALDFANVYRDLLEENDIVWKVAGYRNDWKKKLAVLTGNAIYRQNRVDQVIYWLLFAAGYL